MIRARIPWRAFAFGAAHLAAVFVCAWALSSYAHFGRRGLALHMMLVATGMTIGLLALAWTARDGRAPGRISRAVFASLATLGACTLILLYVGSYVGTREWGGGLNYHIVLGNAALALPNRPPFFIPWSAHLSATAAVLVLWLMYWFSWRVIAPDSRVLTSVSMPRRVSALMVLAWICAGGTLTWSLARTGTLSREPIAGFVVTGNGEFGFSQYSLDRQLPEQALRARSAYPRDQIFARKNVIVIFVDALRADHMGIYGYERPTTPFLSSLLVGNRLRRVDLALSSCAESSCGILSTMTSKPFRHLSTPNFSLLNLLRDQGYGVYQILSADHTFAGERAAYGHEQTLYFDSSSSTRFSVNDDNVVFEGLERVPPYGGQPALLHFHLMSAHFAGVKHEAFRRYEPWFVRPDFASLINSKRDLVALTNNYDNGVLEADDTIRRLFQELERKGYLSNSVVVILADHGEGLGDRDAGPEGLGHVHSLHQEFIRIPLLFYDSADAPYANLSFATQIDVAPTIIDRLGLVVPPSWEGRSLLNPEPRRYTYMQTSRWSPCYALVERSQASTLKYMWCEESGDERVYQLDTDPMERNDLLPTEDSAVTERLRRALRELLASTSVQ